MSPLARVVVATPLDETLCRLIENAEPRIELVREQSLLPPMRWPADFAGDPSFHRSKAEQRRFDNLIDTADVLYGIPDVDPAALARTVRSNPRLRWVQVMAAGGGGQVKSAALTAEELERVSFTTSAGVHGEPLAEFALFGLLAGAKTLPRLVAQQRTQQWSGRWTMGQLSEQTVMLLGLGGIGSVLARKLTSLGATVVGVSRHSTVPEGVDRVVHPADIIAEAPRVDAVVNTLPGTATTEHLLGDTFFRAVTGGITVVNVGRGTVIDESALESALDAGRVGFAALDVFETEPLPTTSPLWARDDVLISPHTAGLSASEDRRIAELFARNATRFLDGDELINRVNTVEFY